MWFTIGPRDVPRLTSQSSEAWKKKVQKIAGVATCKRHNRLTEIRKQPIGNAGVSRGRSQGATYYPAGRRTLGTLWPRVLYLGAGIANGCVEKGAMYKEPMKWEMQVPLHHGKYTYGSTQTGNRKRADSVRNRGYMTLG